MYFLSNSRRLAAPRTWLHVLKPKRLSYPPPPPPPNSPLLLRVSYSLSLICQPDIRGHEAPHHHCNKFPHCDAGLGVKNQVTYLLADAGWSFQPFSLRPVQLEVTLKGSGRANNISKFGLLHSPADLLLMYEYMWNKCCLNQWLEPCNQRTLLQTQCKSPQSKITMRFCRLRFLREGVGWIATWKMWSVCSVVRLRIEVLSVFVPQLTYDKHFSVLNLVVTCFLNTSKWGHLFSAVNFFNHTYFLANNVTCLPSFIQLHSNLPVVFSYNVRCVVKPWIRLSLVSRRILFRWREVQVSEIYMLIIHLFLTWLEFAVDYVWSRIMNQLFVRDLVTLCFKLV